MQTDQDQTGEKWIRPWRESAPYWEKHRDVIRGMFAPVTQALVEAARIKRGDAVLDIASGPGEPALSVVAVVGEEGKVVGTDPAREMVAAACREKDLLGVKNIEFEVAFADRLPFPDDSFDALVCRFGAMFFPSPVEAARELLRVLKPGGTMALAVWGFPETNPFLRVLQGLLDQYREAPPAAPPDSTGDAFRFASPGKLREVLLEAGATEVSERLLAFRIEAPVPVEEFWILRCQISEKLRESLAALSEDQRIDAKRRGIELLRAYATGDGMKFPAEVLILSGAKRA